MKKTSKAKIMNNTRKIFKYLYEFPEREMTIQSKLF